jgi:hypothetical protein
MMFKGMFERFRLKVCLGEKEDIQHSYQLDENCDLKTITLALLTFFGQKHQNQLSNRKVLLPIVSFLQG